MMLTFLRRRNSGCDYELMNLQNHEIMTTLEQQLHKVTTNKANTRYNVVQKDIQTNSEGNIIKEWQKKMMPNYERAEIWLDDSIEPIKWQNNKLERYKQL